MVYTVGEMAKVLDVNTSTLRYYDSEGLLPYVERSSGGMRMFSEKDYEALMVINCLKKSGLTIKEIKQFIEMTEKGDETIEERLKLFENRRKAVQKQIDELQKTKKLLDYKCWYYQTAKKAGSEQYVKNISPEKIPDEIREAKNTLKLKSV